ncbi:MAG: hypothetical protein O7B99_09495 [Planctomycetota bacterium]|nr:hypothetical protein [Planctomycetota bacterium]
METKEIAFDCPCCQSRITIDVRTRRVLNWRRPGEVDAQGKPLVTEKDWESAHGKVAGRLQAGEDRFDAGLAREKNRGKDLDDLFSKASEKLDDDDEDEDD